ncbi:hypothetical protein F5Y02DRAFT_169254 [Annulohypoxylon stygium]|nr:hypothetical protein F5Y02DRAFT_169254 [Annulohypoxylon stygium]
MASLEKEDIKLWEIHGTRHGTHTLPTKKGSFPGSTLYVVVYAARHRLRRESKKQRTTRILLIACSAFVSVLLCKLLVVYICIQTENVRIEMNAPLGLITLLFIASRHRRSDNTTRLHGNNNIIRQRILINSISIDPTISFHFKVVSSIDFATLKGVPNEKLRVLLITSLNEVSIQGLTRMNDEPKKVKTSSH